CGQGTNVPFTF
nr:immunoglobulin light chain junction region [Macaca mulatta]MOW74698.1 immunoglobulin light chain junction region [Macaca mulatta]